MIRKHFSKKHQRWPLMLLLLYSFIKTTTNAAKIAEKLIDAPVYYHRDQLVNISRHHNGDIFSTKDIRECNSETCIGLSSGTATIYENNRHLKDSKNAKNNQNDCNCQCLSHLLTYREDLGICTDEIRECPVILPFVSNTAVEKIPSVFLPLSGQIIYPSREISLTDFEKSVSVCVVSGAQFLTSNGWADLRNSVDSDVPFRLFRDEKRTFLQWIGDNKIRSKMQGRLIVVHLICRKSTTQSDTEPAQQISVTTPCVSFRVIGVPIKYINNVTEVLFSSESTLTDDAANLSNMEYILIAIASLCLGLIYIASVFLYIYMKKKKDGSSHDNTSPDAVEAMNKPPTNSQVSFGAGISAPINHTTGFYKQDGTSVFMDPTRLSLRTSNSLRSIGPHLEPHEANVIKNNPLLKHFPMANDNSGFISDSSISDHDNLDSGNNIINMNNQQHYNMGFIPSDNSFDISNNGNISSNESERLPEENVSITEDMYSSEEKFESARAMVNGTVRRKLYFNPAYFEPQLLAVPPQSAIDFLVKIREVITLAKNKMSSKRFQPSLIGIPEEIIYSGSIVVPSTSRKSSIISSRRDSSRRSHCEGCPGCELAKSNDTTAQANCKNCGDKQNSIQKWLETVSSISNKSESNLETEKNNFKQDENQSTINTIFEEEDIIEEVVGSKSNSDSESNSGSDHDTIITNLHKTHKTTEHQSFAPKIISHSLKANGRTEIKSFNKLQSNEIYNNPKFDMNNSAMCEVNTDESSSLNRKREVFDQYTNMIKQSTKRLHKSHNEQMNLHTMPDMIYDCHTALEAIEMEKNSKVKPLNMYQMPTPDYNSSEYEMTKFKKKDVITFIPFVPTPDYNSYNKNTLRKHYQPDSPIYSRKSPAIIIDYETDSLERVNTYKSRTTTPTTTASDFSSQPSPSLSTALPLEEEVEIRNALYDRVEGFRRDTDSIKKEREIDLQMKKTKIKYNTPSAGSMTIELEATSPEEYNGDSADEFEPDTLDRKTKKNNCLISRFNNENTFTPLPYTQINEQLTSLPELSSAKDLRTLRKLELEKGRLLTLELRHSKRQRCIGYASLDKNSVPPDVVLSNNLVNNDVKSERALAQTIEVDEEPEMQVVQQSNGSNFGKNKTVRGHNMDISCLISGLPNNGYNFEAMATTAVYHLEIPPPPFVEEQCGSVQEDKKQSKDMKHPWNWKRLVDIATKLRPKTPVDKSTFDEPTITKSHTVVNDIAGIKNGKVKDIINRLNTQTDPNRLKEHEGLTTYDLGYVSGGGTESFTNSVIPVQTVIEKPSPKRPTTAPPPIPLKKPMDSTSYLSSFDNSESLVNINIFSSDDEECSSFNSNSDDESGAESIETNSVFYKNIRKTSEN